MSHLSSVFQLAWSIIAEISPRSSQRPLVFNHTFRKIRRAELQTMKEFGYAKPNVRFGGTYTTSFTQNYERFSASCVPKEKQSAVNWWHRILQIPPHSIKFTGLLFVSCHVCQIFPTIWLDDCLKDVLCFLVAALHTKKKVFQNDYSMNYYM